MFDVFRSVFHIGPHDADITPAKIWIRNVVGSEISQHLAAPCDSLFWLVTVDHHAEFPWSQLGEGRIKFAVQKSLLVMLKPFNGIHGIGSIRFRRGIHLGNGCGMFQAHCQSQAIKDVVVGALTNGLNIVVDLESGPVLRDPESTAETRGTWSIRHEHLLHECGVVQHVLYKCLL